MIRSASRCHPSFSREAHASGLSPRNGLTLGVARAAGFLVAFAFAFAFGVAALFFFGALFFLVFVVLVFFFAVRHAPRLPQPSTALATDSAVAFARRIPLR